MIDGADAEDTAVLEAYNRHFPAKALARRVLAVSLDLVFRQELPDLALDRERLLPRHDDDPGLDGRRLDERVRVTPEASPDAIRNARPRLPGLVAGSEQLDLRRALEEPQLRRRRPVVGERVGVRPLPEDVRGGCERGEGHWRNVKRVIADTGHNHPALPSDHLSTRRPNLSASLNEIARHTGPGTKWRS